MPDRRGATKLIVLALAFLAVVGGAAYWFFGVRAKNQARAAAQAEVTAWEARLADARTCLFGATPASGDSGEAFAVRELTPDVWDRSSCTTKIGKLARGVADDTGLMPVEHAWMTLDRAAAKVATAFAVSKDPYGRTAADDRRGVSELPDALRELDKAHAELRQAAGLPPADNVAKVPTLPVAQVLPLQTGGTDVVELAVGRASLGTLVMPGLLKDGPVQVTLVPGKAPALQRTAVHAMRSLPAGDWAAQNLLGKLVVSSTIDAKGELGAPTGLAEPAPPSGPVLAVVGGYRDGAVVFRGPTGLAFAHADATGASFVHAPPPAVAGARTQAAETSNEIVALDPAGRALVVWTEYPPAPRATDDDAPEQLLRALVVTGAASRGVVELGSGDPASACLTATHGWVYTADELLRVDTAAEGAAVTPFPATGYGLAGCSSKAVLMSNPGTTRYRVCSADCRDVDLRGARPTDIATLAGDRVVSLAVRDRVLAVWFENGPAKFYRLPEKVVLRRAISDGTTIDVVAESATENKPLRYVVVRIPV